MNITKKNVVTLLDRTQRPILIRLSRANRTISTAAAQVLARQLPYDLRCKILIRKDLAENDDIDDEETPKYTKEEALAEWQDRLTALGEDGPGLWTRQLIPNISTWYNREHGEMTYPLVQMLSGHGSFMKYLKKMAKVDTELCILCNSGEADTTCHTFELCASTAHLRESFEEATGRRPTTCKGILEFMLENDTAWRTGTEYVRKIIAAKDERIRSYRAELDARRQATSTTIADENKERTNVTRAPEATVAPQQTDLQGEPAIAGSERRVKETPK